jgi:hypothetical protein
LWFLLVVKHAFPQYGNGWAVNVFTTKRPWLAFSIIVELIIAIGTQP